jgi:5'-3' exonuclease
MTENGEHIGGTVGFFNNMCRLVEKTKPEAVIVVWEGGGSKRKRDLFPEYKKKSKPQNLNRYYDNDIPNTYQNRNFQVRTLIELLKLIPICQVYISDAEADDAIGYMTSYTLKDKNVIIVSSDHDFYQLVSERVIIWSPTLKSFVDTDKIMDRYNIHPKNFCLAKCISGDPSDNIPGVKGVGYKSIAKRFQKFTECNEYNIPDLICDAAIGNKDSKAKIYERIVKEEKLIKRNLRLVRLDTNNISHDQIKNLENSIENFTPKWDNIGAHRMLKSNCINNIDLLRYNHILRHLKKGKIK